MEGESASSRSSVVILWPKYPLLPLPKPVVGESPQHQGFGAKDPMHPSAERQGQRFGPIFERLHNVLQHDSDGLSLRNDPTSIAPERALVLEVAGSISDFYGLVTRFPGLEYLGEDQVDFEPDENFFELDNQGEPRTDRRIRGRLYLSMPDISALQQLLSLWKRWQSGEDLPHGFTPWRDLFSYLRNIRPWGPRDRVADETVSIWREEIETDPHGSRRIEVELWHHDRPQSRDEAYGRFAKAVVDAGGRIVDHAVIESIRYEAALIIVPAKEVARLATREEVHLAICDDVMFLRPQFAADIPTRNAEYEVDAGVPNAYPALTPVAALLDGVPVQNHALLQGRLDMDDPDDLEGMSVLADRHHGTGMASLILHGDRNLPGTPLARRLYVRPVLYAPGNDAPEEAHRDRLLVDVIHKAVLRMKEGDGEDGPTAPDVFLVNLSLGDSRRQFAGPMSPWAKLLDYLAERYELLFLVSAGNILEPLPLSDLQSWTAFEDATPQSRERAVLKALSEQKIHRTLLSPAEALNVVTIGAMHHDAVTGPLSGGTVDPYEIRELPNVSSAMGLGHRRIIKPEILLPGGREHVRLQSSDQTLSIVPVTRGRHGIRAASPDAQGDLNRTRLIPGTSAATALATRSAHLIFDALMDRDGGSMPADMDPKFRAVVVKALLVHQANWGDNVAFLDKLFEPHGIGKHSERRDNIARMVGHGAPTIERSLTCAPHRATLVGYGTINAGETYVHRIPLPRSLQLITEPRQLTVTVAWLSPVNPRHQSYRQANLDVGSINKLEDAVGVSRIPLQPSNYSASRGTVFHSHYQGERSVPFLDDGHVSLRIQCREPAGTLDREIRYGIALTIAANEGIPVYDEVRTRLVTTVRPEV